MSADEPKEKELPFLWKRVFLRLNWITVLTVFVLDQASKFAVVTYIRMGTQIEILPFINLVHTKNRGAAFGMFHNTGASFRLLFFGAVTIVCLYTLIHWLGTIDERKRFQRFCFSLILGGAFGNLLDRICFGEVTDFVDAYYNGYHFYVFNIADSAITVGVTLLIAQSIPWTRLKNFRFSKRAKAS